MGFVYSTSQNLNIWGVFWTKRVKIEDSVVGRWRVGEGMAGDIRSLINARYFELECARVLHETFLVLVLMYGKETMLCKEEISRIRAFQMDNLRGLLGIRRGTRGLGSGGGGSWLGPNGALTSVGLPWE